MVKRSNTTEILQQVAVALVFAALCFALTLPIFDPDFWWHLASGKWMWANGTMINGDPFTIDSVFKKINLNAAFVLKQYWLSQVIFYGVYALSGYTGIIFLGAMVFTMMFFLLYRLMRDAGGGRTLSLLLVFMAVKVIVGEFGYVGIRPQMWSSLFALVIVFLLERLRRGVPWTRWAVPLLMVVWSNLHGGFVLGDVIIVIYLVGGVISRTADRRFVLTCIGAVLASGINPNGYVAFISAPLVGSLLALFHLPGYDELKGAVDSISEGQSIFQHASVAGILRRLPWFAGVFTLSIASFLVNLRRTFRERPELILLYLLVFLMGLRSIRYIVFFASIASYLTVVNLGPLRERFAALRERLPRFLPATVSLLILLALAARLAVAGYVTTALGREPVTSEFRKAADFIRANGLSGNMLNDYNGGGYLIWRLSPEIKVFVDGRILYGDTFNIYRAVVDSPFANDTRAGENYRVILKYFNVDLVLMPGCDRVSGTLIKLVAALVDDPGWELIYDDRDVLLFMKKQPSTMAFLGTHSLDKARAYRNIYSLAKAASADTHAAMMPNWKLSMAYAHAGAGDPDEGLRLVREYREKRPDDTFAETLERRLENTLRKGSP